MTPIGKKQLIWVSFFSINSDIEGDDLPTASTLIKKYKRARLEQQESKDYYFGLTAQAPAELIPKWTAEVTEAERKRVNSVEAMDIYQARVPKAKGRKEVEIELGQQELERDMTGQASWLSYGLQLEEAQ